MSIFLIIVVSGSCTVKLIKVRVGIGTSLRLHFGIIYIAFVSYYFTFEYSPTFWSLSVLKKYFCSPMIMCQFQITCWFSQNNLLDYSCCLPYFMIVDCWLLSLFTNIFPFWLVFASLFFIFLFLCTATFGQLVASNLICSSFFNLALVSYSLDSLQSQFISIPFNLVSPFLCVALHIYLKCQHTLKYAY